MEKGRQATVSISGCQYIKLEIIILTAEIDNIKSSGHNEWVETLKDFQHELIETNNFYSEFQGSDSILPDENQLLKEQLAGISLRGNILLFYLRGEILEGKLGEKLSENKKNDFEDTCKEQHFASVLFLRQNYGHKISSVYFCIKNYTYNLLYKLFMI